MKRVEHTDIQNGQREVLAIFTLVGDQVVADYRDPSFAFEMKVHGITVNRRELHPEDGRPFYDGLEAGLYGSSHVTVVHDD